MANYTDVIGYVVDGELYCPDCGDAKGTLGDSPIFGGSETDCPNHCGECEELIPESLTSDGIAYVLEALDDYRNGVAEGTDPRGRLCILQEWAGLLSSHVLSTSEGTRLERWERFEQRQANKPLSRCACGLGACKPGPTQ